MGPSDVDAFNKKKSVLLKYNVRDMHSLSKNKHTNSRNRINTLEKIETLGNATSSPSRDF